MYSFPNKSMNGVPSAALASDGLGASMGLNQTTLVYSSRCWGAYLPVYSGRSSAAALTFAVKSLITSRQDLRMAVSLSRANSESSTPCSLRSAALSWLFSLLPISRRAFSIFGDEPFSSLSDTFSRSQPSTSAWASSSVRESRMRSMASPMRLSRSSST